MTIPLSDCVDRHIYALGSRNLVLGVFRKGTNGFVGIREKFGDFYLFEEYHWDCGPPYGTVTVYEDVGILPDEISMSPNEQTIDSKTNRAVDFDRTKIDELMYPGGPNRMKGWFFLDTGEFSRNIMPVSRMNQALFAHLGLIERKMELRSNHRANHDGDD